MSETIRETVADTPLEPLRERLAKNPDGIVERIAREYGVSTLAVIEALPAAHRTLIKGELFADVMKNSKAGARSSSSSTHRHRARMRGTIPAGRSAAAITISTVTPDRRHIRAEACSRIRLLARPFMGRQSCSIQFFNGDGEAMFKVFVRRDEKREMLAHKLQVRGHACATRRRCQRLSKRCRRAGHRRKFHGAPSPHGCGAGAVSRASLRDRLCRDRHGEHVWRANVQNPSKSVEEQQTIVLDAILPRTTSSHRREQCPTALSRRGANAGAAGPETQIEKTEEPTASEPRAWLPISRRRQLRQCPRQKRGRGHAEPPVAAPR